MYRSVSIWQKKNCIDRTAIRRAVHNTVGYGPFSKTVKGCSAVEKNKRQEAKPTKGGESRGGDDASVIGNIQLYTNLSLRLSLAALVHPTQLEKLPYRSSEWRLAFVRLYRAILRLHNKTVAMSLAEPTSSKTAEGELDFAEKIPENGLTREIAPSDRFVLKYLLTDAQREFGNRFVHDEFHRHTDADHMAASIFYRSWYEYVLKLFSGITTQEMSDSEKRWLTEEQREKLEQLKMAFRLFLTAEGPGHMR